ncbi:MAG: protein translocase subunit SecDF, partial [Bacteroidetes bacterium]|nr:protein translocase subunit SecDF [Bacteroidota bacterium]
MQNKGAVKLFAIIFGLVCLFQLSFTFISYRYSVKAEDYANAPAGKELAAKLAKGDQARLEYLTDSVIRSRNEYFNDSMAGVDVYNIILKKYTLKDVREREINLGLDLKGGMNVTMAVSVPEVIRAMSGYSQDPTFNKALQLAIQKEKNSTADFVDLFAESCKQVDPNAKLAAIFNTVDLKDKINFNTTNAEVIKVLRDETNAAIDRTYRILTTRIDRFGVVQPNIQKLQTAGRILIELPGIKDPERVRKLLQGTAQLEFWETYQFTQLHPYLTEA